MGWLFKGWRRRHVQGLLSEYIDGNLPAGKWAFFAQHLQTCGSCRQELASLMETVGLLRGLAPVPPPRSFALREAPLPKQAPQGGLVAGWRWATAATAALLLALVAVDLLGLFVAAPGPVSLGLERPAGVTTQEAAPSASKAMPDRLEAGGEKAPGPQPAVPSPASPLRPIELALAGLLLALGGGGLYYRWHHRPFMT